MDNLQPASYDLPLITLFLLSAFILTFLNFRRLNYATNLKHLIGLPLIVLVNVLFFWGLYDSLTGGADISDFFGTFLTCAIIITFLYPLLYLAPLCFRSIVRKLKEPKKQTDIHEITFGQLLTLFFLLYTAVSFITGHYKNLSDVGLLTFYYLFILIPYLFFKAMNRGLDPSPSPFRLFRQGQKITVVLRDDWLTFYTLLSIFSLRLQIFLYKLFFPLTAFFPFSLIGRNKLGHHSYDYERKVMGDIEKLATIKRINLKIVQVENRGPFINFLCVVKTKRKTPWQAKFTSDLIEETKIPAIFIRPSPDLTDAVDILVPRMEE